MIVVILLDMTPFFADCLTLQRTKSLIHEKKEIVFCPPPPPTHTHTHTDTHTHTPLLPTRSLLAGLLFRMFSLGFNSAAPAATHRKQTKLKF